MTELVTIQSSRTIRVTSGLQYDDVTNPDAHIPDRLKVKPNWAKKMYIIKEGKYDYPAEIAEWNTVKALERDGILTIAPVHIVPEKEAVRPQKSSKLADIAGE